MNQDQQIMILEDKINRLEKELDKYTKEDKIKDDILIQQSKMAAMGEMIENIAHQYRQPLMEISTLLINIEAKIKLFGSISNDETLEMIDKSNFVLKYLSQTIDDFRNFFTLNKPKEHFAVTEAITTCVNIMKNTLLNENIKLNIIIKENCKIYGVKNEYIQVIINIVSNAKDSIVLNKIQNGQIDIKLYEKNNSCIVEILDNGGGIEINPIEKVFEPFFTYKKQNGTGIGLFMSKLIVEKNMDGVLEVSNQQNGACFKVKILK
ncbi:MAG: HAMP domain-containing histidine kinase [Arcobacteraceae bacterium]|nr:HAMP domain-containing histidine kinase [Arcobacteraceae bacterium]